MDSDPYAVALNNALNEIKRAYPEINHSFIFSEKGTIVSREPETNEENMKKIIVKDSSIPSVVNGSPLYSGGISRIPEAHDSST